MSATRMTDVLHLRTGSRRWALACTLLVAFAAGPLRAQSYQDLYEFNCSTGCGPYDYGRLIQG
ncbi:MAG: hypothetical protein QOF56_2563, partial [Acidobacteriaceae bacterium]|nr:hypothetical protein [Acidobacteriaceae bacterium]